MLDLQTLLLSSNIGAGPEILEAYRVMFFFTLYLE